MLNFWLTSSHPTACRKHAVKQTGTTGPCAKGCTGLGIIVPTSGDMRRTVPYANFAQTYCVLGSCLLRRWSGQTSSCWGLSMPAEIEVNASGGGVDFKIEDEKGERVHFKLDRRMASALVVMGLQELACLLRLRASYFKTLSARCWKGDRRFRSPSTTKAEMRW